MIIRILWAIPFIAAIVFSIYVYQAVTTIWHYCYCGAGIGG